MTEFVYSTTRPPQVNGRVFRNPRYFSEVEPGAERVSVIGEWPAVVAAYRAAGIEVVQDGVELAPFLSSIDAFGARARAFAAEGKPSARKRGKKLSVTTALVLGGARCVYDDVEAALAVCNVDGVVTCNAITALWPGRIVAAASLHPQRWAGWISAREGAGLPSPDRVLISVDAAAEGERLPGCVTDTTAALFPGQMASGSSGLFALKVALADLGFDRAILCGVPLTEESGHVAGGPVWRGAQHYHPAWHEALPQLGDRVRSMSGWTADLLGSPDAEWLGA